MAGVPQQHDLIVARSTPAGAGAIAIVRVDGIGTAELVQKMFRPLGGELPTLAPRKAVLGHWIDSDGSVIDEGLALFFQGPHSFTGNDLAEFHCHGGTAIVRRLIRAVAANGARPAEPGEFSRRAFLNGRLDLAQAEAISDLILAETDAAVRLANAQLRGGLSRGIESARQTLIVLAAEIEARIDFPDEGIEASDLRRLNTYFTELDSALHHLLVSQKRGKLLREGARVVLVGPPNVGKSSLLNALARTDRAIVTPHPGTTRDTIECRIDLAGIPVTLIDTAGLRDSSEPIEKMGIERSRRAIEESDFIVEVRDASRLLRSESADGMELGRAPHLIVRNKIDLITTQEHQAKSMEKNISILAISALTGQGIEALESALQNIIAGDSISAAPSDQDEVAINERHARLIRAALMSLAEARHGWDEEVGGELIMIDLREALAALDAILGIGPNEAILDHVFETFCIGK